MLKIYLTFSECIRRGLKERKIRWAPRAFNEYLSHQTNLINHKYRNDVIPVIYVQCYATKYLVEKCALPIARTIA